MTGSETPTPDPSTPGRGSAPVDMGRLRAIAAGEVRESDLAPPPDHGGPAWVEAGAQPAPWGDETGGAGEASDAADGGREAGEHRRGGRRARREERRPRLTPAEKRQRREERQAAEREADPVDFARQIALRQLAMAPRSRQQLIDRILAKGCEPHVAEAVVERLAEVGLIDDDAYAQMLVRSQQQTRGLARRALRHELQKKGVDAEVAEAALEQIDDPDEEDRARELVARRLRTMHGLDREVQTRRLAGLLARKGYPSGLSFRVVREALNEAPEHQRD